MEDYIPVTWSSESLSLDKMQYMLQNDQSVIDELGIKPKGIIGYAELTMYASNSATTGYRDIEIYNTPIPFPNSTNTNAEIKEWTRVTDNWNLNPNGLSAHVNVDQARLIHLELYVPLLFHHNPIPFPGSEASNWAIQGFKITRDGVDISGESLMDMWTSHGSGTSVAIHSFYFDCYDLGASPGPHLYEVLWKSEQGLEIALWEQMRHTFNAVPSGVTEPDQQSYISTNAGATTAFTPSTASSGRYNISDFSLPTARSQVYTDTNNYYTGDGRYTPTEMWNSTTSVDAPFAGSMPTAQFTVTDCGSAGALIFHKEDDEIIQDGTNADPAA